MRTIKAVRIHQYGGPETVRVERAVLRNLNAGEVLVRVGAAGVNPVDWKIRAGYLQQAMPLTLPFTLGGDFSGVVMAVGPDVTEFALGAQVYGNAPVLSGGSGSFAESVIAPAGSFAEKPRSLDHVTAGALPLVGVSALQALSERLRILPGDKLLVHGGAGGIGSIAIQLARHLDAHVTATAGTDDIEYVRSLGAHQVIDHRKQKFQYRVGGLDAVLDTVGGLTYLDSFRVLKRGGRLVSLLEAPRADLMEEFGVEASVLYTQVTTQRLRQLADYVDSRAVKVRVDQTFALDAAAEALRYQQQNHPRGKVVLRIA